MAAREKKASKEMTSASKLVTETVKRSADLAKQEAEVRMCLCVLLCVCPLTRVVCKFCLLLWGFGREVAWI
jgi:hypothetical protein